MKMNKEPIYTITTIRSPSFGNVRCIGYFHELENAVEAVNDNAMDMNEAGYYHYVVIEKVGPGFYNLTYITKEHELWFKWNNSDHKYQACDKPDHYKRTVCFGIG